MLLSYKKKVTYSLRPWHVVDLYGHLLFSWRKEVKGNCSSWNDVIDSLLHVFDRVTDSHLLKSKVITKQSRFSLASVGLIAQIASKLHLHKIHKLDMIYGLLNKRIPEEMSLDKVNDFNTFIDKARAIEGNF